MYRNKQQFRLFIGLLMAWNLALADITNSPNPYSPGYGFDTPSEATWGGWLRTGSGSLYAEWDSFVDSSYLGDLTAAPDVGSTAGSNAFISWNAGTFTAGSGNLYSFSVPQNFSANIANSTGLSGPIRAVMQFETWGVQMNYNSMLLNGLSPSHIHRTFIKEKYNSSFGEVEFVQYLAYWDFYQAPQNFLFNFSGGPSTSLAQVAIDIGSVDAATISQPIETPAETEYNGLNCSLAQATSPLLWPPSKGFKSVGIVGITGPNPYALKIVDITQDEPVLKKSANDSTKPDAKIVVPKATINQPMVQESALLRAERQGIKKQNRTFSGNGRVYRIRFNANDGQQTCTGVVTVQVPPSQGTLATLNAVEFDSTKSKNIRKK